MNLYFKILVAVGVAFSMDFLLAYLNNINLYAFVCGGAMVLAVLWVLDNFVEGSK